MLTQVASSLTHFSWFEKRYLSAKAGKKTFIASFKASYSDEHVKKDIWMADIIKTLKCFWLKRRHMNWGNYDMLLPLTKNKLPSWHSYTPNLPHYNEWISFWQKNWVNPFYVSPINVHVQLSRVHHTNHFHFHFHTCFMAFLFNVCIWNT